MSWLALAVLCVVMVEIALLLPLGATLKGFSRTSQKAMRTIASSRISEHWKEKVMLRYSARMMVETLKLFLFLALLAGLILLGIWVAAMAEIPLEDLLLSFPGIGFSILFSVGYVFLRQKLV